MNQNQLLPLILTSKIAETRAFYTEKLGCKLKFDMPHYIQLQFGGERGPEISFMDPAQAPALGAEPQSFGGQGVVVSVPVERVDETHARLKALGAPIVCEPADRPWKWRSFLCRDPNGLLLDFFHPIELKAAG